MPVFIADHTGQLTSQSSFLRPVHIGAAVNADPSRGPEPDDVRPGNISASVAHADLRLYHHVRWNWEGGCEWLALMQYRRMYSLGAPSPQSTNLCSLKKRAAATELGQVHIEGALRGEYLAFLADQSDRILRRELRSSDVVCNGMFFPSESVEQQYISAIAELYAGQEAYVDAWHDLRTILESKLGSALVAECLDGNSGFFNNCIITKWTHFLNYYEFLFEVLDSLNAYRNCYRLYGYLAERVLHPWLLHSGLTVRCKSIVLFV